MKKLPGAVEAGVQRHEHLVLADVRDQGGGPAGLLLEGAQHLRRLQLGVVALDVAVRRGAWRDAAAVLGVPPAQSSEPRAYGRSGRRAPAARRAPAPRPRAPARRSARPGRTRWDRRRRAPASPPARSRPPGRPSGRRTASRRQAPGRRDAAPCWRRRCRACRPSRTSAGATPASRRSPAASRRPACRCARPGRRPCPSPRPAARRARSRAPGRSARSSSPATRSSASSSAGEVTGCRRLGERQVLDGRHAPSGRPSGDRAGPGRAPLAHDPERLGDQPRDLVRSCGPGRRP